MIVSASYRTDIPAFYADWFHAPAAGRVLPRRQPLRRRRRTRSRWRPADVDGFVFWTRNMRPLMADLDCDPTGRAVHRPVHADRLSARRSKARSSRPRRAIEQLRELRRRFGPRVAVWRYDPIVFAAET